MSKREINLMSDTQQALDEEGKKRFWEQNLYPRERASKKK